MNNAQRAGWDLIDEAFELLEQAEFPENFLSVAKQEFLKVCLESSDPGWRDRCFCYLMFFGDSGTATYMKIGVSKSPSCRLAGVVTGNPLEPQWVFAFPFKNRRDAGKAEKALHQHYSSQRTNGEWFRIGSCCESEARVISYGAFRIASEIAEPTGPMAKVEK